MIEMEVKSLFTVMTWNKELLEGTAYEVFTSDADTNKYNILVHGERWTDTLTRTGVVGYICEKIFESTERGNLVAPNDAFVELWWELFYSMGYTDSDVEDLDKCAECDQKFSEKYSIPKDWVVEYWKLYE